MRDEVRGTVKWVKSIVRQRNTLTVTDRKSEKKTARPTKNTIENNETDG